MRRLMLLIAAGSLWLFLAAVPVFADGGPHVKSENNGVSSLTADSCAGCHRVHTAEGAMLLNAPTEEELCLTCHGDAGTGATTDVESGVQYAIGLDGLRDDTAVLGALRAGGFESTRIGDPFRYTVGTSRLGKVQVAATGSPVTSAHIDMTGSLGQPGRAWGNGANGLGPGNVAEVTCASCHNPHGNGQYRILNPIPSGTGINAAWTVQVYDYGVVAPNVYRSVSSMGVMNGDSITITGSTLGAANATGIITMVDAPACPAAPIPAGTTCDSDTTANDTLFTLSTVTAAGSGTGGLATRNGGTKVTDAALPPAGDARNYTVIQTSTTAGYTLLASQAAGYDNTDGDYLHYRVPWNLASGTNFDAPNGIPGSSSAPFTGGFGEQMAAWCASCHTRYWAWSEPTEDPADGGVSGAAYANARPGDDIFTYQHRTRGASGRGCITCHVAHGTSVEMTGTFSANYTFPDGTVSDNSRLLKIDNRGTCQMCHDPTGTSVAGDQFPPAPYPVPGVP